MDYFLVGLACLVAGAVVAVIIYRRKTAEVEAALVEAVKVRDAALTELNTLRSRLGGK